MLYSTGYISFSIYVCAYAIILTTDFLFSEGAFAVMKELYISEVYACLMSGFQSM